MSGAPLAGIWFVDVCGTLVRDDTTLGLLRHHFRRGPWLSRALFRAMTSRPSPLRVAFRVLEKMTRRHLVKHLLVRLLAGTCTAALERSAAEYAAWLLEQRRVPDVWQLLRCEENADCIVLASASLEPIVSQLAARMGVRYVASSLEEHDGVLTGRYLRDLTGCKEQALARKFDGILTAAPRRVVSDNISDRALLESAADAYVVLHDAAHRRRWDGLHATFIEAS